MSEGDLKLVDVKRIMDDHLATLKELTKTREQVNMFIRKLSELNPPENYPPIKLMAWQDCFGQVARLVTKEL